MIGSVSQYCIQHACSPVAVVPRGGPVAITERANTISGELKDTLGRQTATHDQQLQIASELFATQRAALKALVETDVPPMERELERLGAPYTPGRVPR